MAEAVLYEQHAGPLPASDMVIVIRFGGAVWHVPGTAVLAETVRYYRKHGWYEDAEDAMSRGGRDLKKEGQPKGDELRVLVEANVDWYSDARECHWRKLRKHAVHVSGPREEPPLDLLWAVDEAGGEIDVLTTVPPEQQYEAVDGQGFGWRDKLD